MAGGRSKGWSEIEIATGGLAIGLIVFLAGASAAVAADATPPAAFWAAGGAVSGGLLGLLVPRPATHREPDKAGALKAIEKSESQLDSVEPQVGSTDKIDAATALTDAKQGLLGEPSQALELIQQAGQHLNQLQQLPIATAKNAQQANESLGAATAKLVAPGAGLAQVGGPGILILTIVFVSLLALAVVLASGAITPPNSFKPDALQDVTKAVIALASAAGSGLIGIFVPKPAPSTGAGKGQGQAS